MKRFLGLALAAALLGPLPAGAASTINPSVPAIGLPLTSGPVRANFQAAASDINNILGMYPSTSCASIASPTVGQDCLLTSVTPTQTFKWNGTTFRQTATFDISGSGGWTPFFGNLLLTWQQLLPGGLGTSGQALVSNGTGASPTMQSIFTPASISATSPLTWNSGTSTMACPTCVTSVSNSDSTLTISPTTGAVVASLNIGHANTFTAVQSVAIGAIGATSTDGHALANATAAAAGAQQWSPRMRWTGQGWKTGGTPGSQTVDWIAEAVPVQGSANPTSYLGVSSQINGAGFTRNWALTSAGAMGLGTTSPNYAFQINTASGVNALMQFTNATTGSGSGNGAYFGIIDGSSDFRIAQLSATAGIDVLVNATATRAMFVSASGGIAMGGGTTDPGALSALVGGHFQIGSASNFTLSTGELGLAKISASGTAPGAGSLKFAAVAGTNAGTCKIIAYAGTSTTPVTLVDNVGGSC